MGKPTFKSMAAPQVEFHPTKKLEDLESPDDLNYGAVGAKVPAGAPVARESESESTVPASQEHVAVPLANAAPAPAKTSSRAAPAPAAAPAEAPARAREKMTLSLDVGVSEALRNAAVYLARDYATLSDVVEQLVVDGLKRLEETHNNSRPFPPRSREVKTGRPIKR